MRQAENGWGNVEVWAHRHLIMRKTNTNVIMVFESNPFNMIRLDEPMQFNFMFSKENLP